MFQGDRNSGCKRDALPTELSARAAGSRAFATVSADRQPGANGTERGQPEHRGTLSPEIVPKWPACFWVNPAFAPKPHSAGIPDLRELQTDRQNCAIAGSGVQTEIDCLSLPTGMVGEVA